VENSVTEWLKKPQISIQNVKIEFLVSLEEFLPSYFNEMYEAVWTMKNQLMSNNEDLVSVNVHIS